MGRFFIQSFLILILVLGFSIEALNSVAFSAGPSDMEPASPFSVRVEDPNQKLHANAVAICKKTQTALARVLQAHTKGQLAKLKLDTVGEIYADAHQLEEIGKYLAARGETAGVDFQLRAKDIHHAMNPVYSECLRLPGLKSQLQKQYQVLRREAEANTKTLAKVRKLIENQDWDKANVALEGVHYRLKTMAVWYQSKIQQSVMGKYTQAELEINKGIQSVYQQKALPELHGKRKELTPNFDALLKKIDDFTASIGNSGSADLDGNPLSGPEVIEWAAAKWQTIHLNTIKCHGLDLARVSIDQNVSSEMTALLSDYEKFSDKMIAALAKVIEADAKRSGIKAVRQLYIDYLVELATLASQVSNHRIQEAVAGPLDQLAKQSVELAAEVDVYRKATREMLRWRERTARAKTRAYEEKLKTLETAFFEASSRDQNSDGLLSGGAQDTSEAKLIVSASTVMPVLSERLLDQEVVLHNLAGYASKSKAAALGRYRQHLYPQVIAPSTWADQMRSLRADLLLIDQEDQPMTLEAATAWVSAKRGNMEATGGRIAGLYLESVSRRFAMFPDSFGGLFALGRIQPETTQDNPLHQVMMRFKIEPDWVQHRYFFVESP